MVDNPPKEDQEPDIFGLFCNTRNKHLLLFSSSVTSNSFMSLVRELEKIPRDTSELDLLLNTTGGDPHAAYKIAKYLKKRFTKLNIIVPFMAKSAGTLICLAADKLCLLDTAELGPLDIQILESKEGDNASRESTLNSLQVLEQIQKHNLESFTLMVETLQNKQSLQMRISDLITLVNSYCGQTSGKLYSQLDPFLIAKHARSLSIGEHYAFKILTKISQLNQNDAYKITYSLVNNYPDHGYVIDADEMLEIGWPKTKLETLSNNSELLLELSNITYSLLCSGKPMIETRMPAKENQINGEEK